MEMNASKPPCGPVSRDSDARVAAAWRGCSPPRPTRALGRLRLRTLQRSMVADHLIGIDKLETDLWKLADEPRANSNLASNEYFLTIMGLIFLRHATHRFDTARSAIEADKAAGKMPNRPLVAADFSRRRALMLSDRACYDVILKTPKDGNLGAALNAAMEAVEKTFPPLAGQFPKDYERFDNDLLDRMLRMFDGEALRTAAGDVFGRIYQYFLAEFSKQGAHDNGEFFTPPSLVQTIVNVIEPDHGIVFDPACGSGGMLVQSSHFIEDADQDTMKRVTFCSRVFHEHLSPTEQEGTAPHARISGSVDRIRMKLPQFPVHLVSALSERTFEPPSKSCLARQRAFSSGA